MASSLQPEQIEPKKKTKLTDKGKAWFDKAGKPINKLSNKLGAEAFCPTSLDLEADKAARILRTFCMDGFQAEEGSGKTKHKVLSRIPPEVIRNARGLAIFTVMRWGLHWSGAGGSGVIVSRLPNGQWSPPSGILIHTLGLGLIAGADIYDCVCVINNDKGMEGFTRVRATLGGEITAAVGPLGAGKTLDSEVAKRQAPVWAYTKSRGLYLGVQIDGTVILERHKENAQFYGVEGVRHAQILAGGVQAPPGTITQLMETLQAVEGNPYNINELPPPYSPGDHEVLPPAQGNIRDLDETGLPDEKRDHQNI